MPARRPQHLRAASASWPALTSLRALASRLASTTVTAVMLTMRRTVAAGVRICAGAAQPNKMGPMATLWPAADLSRLYAMLALSRLGHTRRFALPCKVLPGNTLERAVSSSALSPCISPSTSKSGKRSCSSARVARILSAEGALLLPKLECDSRATLGVRPNAHS